MSKKPLTAAERFYGPDGPAKAKDHRPPTTSAKDVSIDAYFRQLRERERLDNRRGSTSPLGGLMKPLQTRRK